MIHIEIDRDGATALAKKIEIAMAVEGGQMTADQSQEIVATLLDRLDWTKLITELEKKNTVSIGEAALSPASTFAFAAVHELASAAFESFPKDAFEPVNGVTPPEDVPFILGRLGRDKMSVRYLDALESNPLDDPNVRGSEIVSDSPVQLGIMFATAIAQELELDPRSLASFADREIEFNTVTETHFISRQPESEICPHCEASLVFVDYAKEQRLPPPDENFYAIKCGHLILFRPYGNEERLFALHRCDGAIYPAEWNANIVAEFNTNELTIGTPVLLASGLVQGPPGSEFHGLPVEGVIRDIFEQEDGDDEEENYLAALLAVPGRRELLYRPLEDLIPNRAFANGSAAQHIH